MTTLTKARASKLVDAEKALAAEAVGKIDWKSRFEKQVSDGIEHKAIQSEKLAEAQRDLNKARLQIKDLEKRVRDLEPAQTKLDKALKDRTDSDTVWAAKIADRDSQIKTLKLQQGRGQRQVLEDAIQWIQAKADRLPEPIRAEEIELDPPTSGVFE